MGYTGKKPATSAQIDSSADIVDGVIQSQDIQTLDAAKLTGTVIDARISALTASKLTGTVADARISTLTASKLTGALPAISGASLTNLPASGATISANDPTITSNLTLGSQWSNSTSGEFYVCTDATTNANKWINVGTGTGDIIPNIVPTNPTNTGSFVDLDKSVTTAFTFTGGTDSDGTVTHYLVDTISNASLLAVTTAEVAAGVAHSFVTQSVGSDTAITFRVRTKDNDGDYSTGVTVSFNILVFTGTVATGGSITTVGDYKVHTFNSSGTFQITTNGSTPVADYLVIAGGGAGGSGHAGGGGAGGYRNSYNNETSGRNSASETNFATTANTYTITVGGGGTGAVYAGPSTSGTASSIVHSGTSISITTVGGGRGGWGGGAVLATASGATGGSGGGGASENGYGGNPGSGTTGQGFDGGQAKGYHPVTGAGGGGASSAGEATTSTGSDGGDAGNGLYSSITGSSIARAGGGGGCAAGTAAVGAAGTGGGTAGSNTSGPATSAGAANTGGGSGGGRQHNSGNGGTGVVIIRYKFQ